MFVPRKPETLAQTQLTSDDIESLVLKALLNVGSASGRRLADQLKLSFGMLQETLHSLKAQMLLAHKGAAPMSDYEYELSSSGVERARRYNARCTYCGSAPVSLDDYIESVKKQSVRQARPRIEDLRAAFDDLILPPELMSQIGQAVNCGRGLFLYGPPGNGKSSIAERLMRCIGHEIWIPRTIAVGREIIRLYDPASHVEVPVDDDDPLVGSSQIDRRWIRIRRPTVVVGGELTLEHLEVTTNPVTGINEAPIQFKSNCGALVVDDFGRQRASTSELLNRWIIPLEKGHDFVGLPSGRQIQIPFDQLLVFATNLEPKQIVDEAFLRRISYKIELTNPSQALFCEIFRKSAPELGFSPDEAALEHLLKNHFTDKGRSLRYGYARDILEQVRNYCEFHEQPLVLSPQTIDLAVKNYFAGL